MHFPKLKHLSNPHKEMENYRQREMERCLPRLVTSSLLDLAKWLFKVTMSTNSHGRGGKVCPFFSSLSTLKAVIP